MTLKLRNQKQALLQDASSLLLVTAVCGAGGALTTTANAAVMATPLIAFPLIVPNNIDGVYINVVTGATGADGGATTGWDINPYSATGLAFFSPPSPAGGAMLTSGGTTAANLPVGTEVGALGTYSGLTPVVPFGGASPNWVLNTSNYFGFRFIDEDDSSVHFGWGRMVVGATANNRSIAELYYESTAGMPINVGAVPEPTGALLAAGAAGLVALRRRRQAA